MNAHASVYFPLSGNPLGFNHLAIAEVVLRNRPALRRVVFIPSNGHHPDPSKSDAEMEASIRLSWAELALKELALPATSHLARVAERSAEPLRLSQCDLEISGLEFEYSRAVRLAESVAVLRREAGVRAGPRFWVVGSDLVRRMADPAIFSAEDLAELAEHCRFIVMGRAGDGPEGVVARLEAERGIRLRYDCLTAEDAPDWLRPFLWLSSTCIREAAEAGDPLEGMLPHGVAEDIIRRGAYRNPAPGASLVSPLGGALEQFSPLQLRLHGLRRKVEEAASALSATFRELNGRHGAPKLALVESSTGGLLTTSLASHGGASQFFLQSRFVYDERAKTALSGAGPKAPGVVSEQAVAALAQGMLRESGADLCLAESGMAGPPDGVRRSMKSGLCCFALATQRGTETHTLQLAPFQTRVEHQLSFALQGLALLNGALAEKSFNTEEKGSR